VAGLRDLERRYRGVWIAVLVAVSFYVVELALRVYWLGFRLRETLLSFEDNYLRWLVLILVVVFGVVVNKRNREAALTQQILDTLNDEIATPLAMVYTQLELISIRAPGLTSEDIEKLAGVQRAVMRIANLVRELSEGRPAATQETSASGASPR
jgi:signal transduction histidine kinase